MVEAEWLSVDPYMRYKAREISLGSTMFGSQVARVIESRNDAWKVGTLMVHYFGWRTHTHISGQTLQLISDQANTNKPMAVLPLPDMEDLPTSLGIGILGMPG